MGPATWNSEIVIAFDIEYPILIELFIVVCYVCPGQPYLFTNHSLILYSARMAITDISFIWNMPQSLSLASLSSCVLPPLSQIFIRIQMLRLLHSHSLCSIHIHILIWIEHVKSSLNAPIRATKISCFNKSCVQFVAVLFSLPVPLINIFIMV